MRRRTKPARVNAEAKRLPSDQSRKKPISTLRELETHLADALEQLQRRSRELVEAHEQQTATSEILRVISGSPTDEQDSEVDPEHQYQAVSRAIGWRSGLFVPMLREGAPIGIIEVVRAEPWPFSDNEIELLKTFANGF